MLSKNVIDGHVNEFDGNVSFGNPNRGLFGGNIRKGEPRLAQNQNGFREIENYYEQPNVNPTGQVKYKDGELVE